MKLSDHFLKEDIPEIKAVIIIGLVLLALIWFDGFSCQIRIESVPSEEVVNG